MPGYEFIGLIFDYDNQYLYAEELTPSGDGKVLAKSRKVKSNWLGDNISMKDLRKAREEFSLSMEEEGWRPIPDNANYLTRPLSGNSQQEYEYCSLALTWWETKPGYGTALSVAHQLTPELGVLIDKSIEGDKSDKELKARLWSAGWQPIRGEVATPPKGPSLEVLGAGPVRGWVTILKRPLGAQARPEEPGTTAKGDPADRLKKLGELRDAGVLTEKEFQKKKKEILAEM